MWNRLNPSTVHLFYLSLGAFLTLFMLFSSFIKNTLYFGEANIAILIGAALGPFAGKALNPNIWTNFDIVVLEASRVVLIIQCFAVAIELPKYYVEKHWKSLLWLVGPVVVWGWMVRSLLVWFMVPRLSWHQSMTIASCFNAIDPVLAATIVGRTSKFGKRVPKHLRDLLQAESGSNGVTTSVALGLSILLTRYPGSAGAMTRSLVVYTILYQIFLAVTVGFIIGFAAKHALRHAESNEWIDRESFLAFYLMVALFCTGLGSLLGIDDVLMAFAAGYEFDRQDWFHRKVAEGHVSGSVDIILNLTFFVFLGAIIPWSSFNQPDLHISAGRLVLGTFLIFLLRRIPAILVLKPVIPDVKTWREALFYGHFGPIGVGAVFSAALISSDPGMTGIAGNLLHASPDDAMQNSLWPIVTFVVLCSSIVHGSSIPLFKFGQTVNSLTITISYTPAADSGPAGMNRLPEIQKTTHASHSADLEVDYSPLESLPPIGLPHEFLRRQQENKLYENRDLNREIITRRQGNKDWENKISLGEPSSASAAYLRRRRSDSDMASKAEVRSSIPSSSHMVQHLKVPG